jgi:predicted lipoprotein with Yx(FWY)xxD motif
VRPLRWSPWAYNGHPLYFWSKDTKPGDVTGDGVDGFHVAR